MKSFLDEYKIWVNGSDEYGHNTNKMRFDVYMAGVKASEERAQVLVDCMEMYKEDHRLIGEALQEYKKSTELK